MVLGLLALSPGTALASTATVGPLQTSQITPEDSWDVLTYVADPGEANALTVRWIAEGASGSGDTWILHDPGALVTAGESCSAVDPHTVHCRRRPPPATGPPRTFQARLLLGDGSDAFSWIGPTGSADNVVAEGGAGADRLSGPAAADEETAIYLLGGGGHDRLHGGAGSYKILRGGDGDDHIVGGMGYAMIEGRAGDDVLIGTSGIDDINGGGGRDRLFGRGGSDRMTDGDKSGATGEKRPGPDLLDAGAGLHDEVSYARRRRSLSIDLRAGGTEGESGEGDRVVGVEDLLGGRGNDRLIGNDRANFIDAGGGSDRLVGGRGDDVLFADGGTLERARTPSRAAVGGTRSPATILGCTSPAIASASSPPTG